LRGRRPDGPAESDILADRRRGRGAQTNVSGRYEPQLREAFDDDWGSLEELPDIRTEVQVERARRIITRNQSPDISFDRSINPYRGCEHGCSYCFARPTHANMGLSPGLDFETKLFVKPDAPRLLEKELAEPGYEPRTIAIGTNTDPYQPIERQYRIMRQILEVLSEANHPVGIVTKSALVAPRHRHSRLHGRTRPRQGGAFGDDVGPATGARHGAARRDPVEADRNHPESSRRPAFPSPS
jgi:hypothetical protein